MPGLAPEKRDGGDRLEGNAPDRARRGVDAGGHVDGDHGERTHRDLLDHLRHNAGYILVQACSVDCIDDDLGAFETLDGEGLDCLVPAPGHFLRIALEVISPPVKGQPDLIPPFAKIAGADEAIAPIVPRTAQHGDAAPPGKAPDNLFGCGAACIFHHG